jgi:uncharacterized protein (TIGR03083 family)
VEAGSVAIVLHDRAREFGELVRTAPDPDQPVRGSDWTVREVATHVTVIAESYAEYLGGDATPVLDLHDLAATNAAALRNVGERHIGSLAGRIEAAVERFVELAAGHADDDTMQLHGYPTPVGAARGVLLGELVVHGQDVARTLGSPWQVAREDATVILQGTSRIAANFVDPERSRSDAAFEIRLRGGPSFVLRFAKGRMEPEDGRARDADCRISADPVALLQVLYALQSQWPAILRGQLVAFGRRPWLALGLAKRFSGF